MKTLYEGRALDDNRDAERIQKALLNDDEPGWAVQVLAGILIALSAIGFIVLMLGLGV